jgi:hypothetical protein
VTKERRNLRNKRYNNLYSSHDIVSEVIKENEVGRACGRYGRCKKGTRGFQSENLKGTNS